MNRPHNSARKKPRYAPRRRHFHELMDRRDALYAKMPYCHWCGTRVFMGKGHGDRLATLDHVLSWPECKSEQQWADPMNQVLACRACNQRRSDEYCRRRDAEKQLLR